MTGDLFGDLPPPSNHQKHPPTPPHKSLKITETNNNSPSKPPISLPIPPLKSALKRPQFTSPNTTDGGSEKKLRFKTTTDASVSQIVEAMQKIASHIGNTTKFSKASKLAIQLIQAGSVKPETADAFFSVLEAAMLSTTSCNDASVRSDYHALFSAAQDAKEFLNKQQKNWLNAWTIHSVVANDLYTDDSFVFSKAAGRVKDLVSNLPIATKEDDALEAATLQEEMTSREVQTNQNVSTESTTEEESDPFGLDALISSKPKREERSQENKGKEVEEEMRHLKLQREAIINCLEIAAKRYKIPWCQTVIDILVKHAYDNVSRFTSPQRDAIGKLWASIREQQTRRKQGKSVSGKLDVTAFELLQEKYSNEKISIRRAVGGSGDRRCQQWLG